MKRVLITGVLAAVMALGGGIWLTQQRTATTGQEIDLPGAAVAQESGAAQDIVIEEMMMGDVNAPVEVIEYASYTCPHCANFHKNVFEKLKADYIDTGKVKFVYREVYFDKYGIWASMVSRCGGADKFFGITSLIYKTQKDWARAGSDGAIADELRKIGRIAGIDGDQLEMCLSDNAKARALVSWYQENATKHGIKGTPSFVIDGTTYSNMSYDDFRALLDERLNG